jgi:hypothetical protein
LVPASLCLRQGGDRQGNGTDIRQIDRDRDLPALPSECSRMSDHRDGAYSPRSAGGEHDFFSEADYFWPDPANPAGPYIEKDD